MMATNELSRAERNLLKAVQRAQAVARTQEDLKKRRALSFLSRRAKIAERFRAKLFAEASAAAHIDWDEIDRRQASDWDAVEAFLTAERKRAAAASPSVRKAHMARVEARRNAMKKRRFPMPGPSSSAGASLDSASAIVFRTFQFPDPDATLEKSSEISPLSNVANFKYSCNFREGVIPAEADVEVQWQFLWTPPFDGLLAFLSSVQLNGDVSWAAKGDCRTGAEAAVWLGVGLGAWQLTGGGLTNAASQPGYFDFHDSSHSPEAGSLTRSGHHIFNDDVPLVFDNNGLRCSITAGVPVLVVISVNMSIEAQNGKASFDFASRDFGINVPQVLIGAYSS